MLQHSARKSEPESPSNSVVSGLLACSVLCFFGFYLLSHRRFLQRALGFEPCAGDCNCTPVSLLLRRSRPRYNPGLGPCWPVHWPGPRGRRDCGDTCQSFRIPSRRATGQCRTLFYTVHIAGVLCASATSRPGSLEPFEYSNMYPQQQHEPHRAAQAPGPAAPPSLRDFKSVSSTCHLLP